VANLPARQDHAGVPVPRNEFVGFQVTGKTPALWTRLQSKFIARIEQLVELVQSDDPAATWFREQAREFRDLAIDHFKAKLRKEGLESEKIEAEVAKLFAETERARAEARETNAKAKQIEVDTTIKELRLSLGMTKAMLIGERGRKAALFGKQVDAMLAALKELTETSRGG
jgi:hypothetical protein